MTKSSISMGDVNEDGTINASDAAEILIAAATFGAEMPTDLSAEQQKSADVNDDGSLNATDAAIILIYAAAVGAGITDARFEDYIVSTNQA